MNQREKLAELMVAGFFNWKSCGEKGNVYEGIADFLIESGIKIPKCKAGDKVYFVFFDDERGIYDYCDATIKDVCDRGVFTSPYLDEREGNPENWELTLFDDEDMFLSIEEAKQSIEERSLVDVC